MAILYLTSKDECVHMHVQCFNFNEAV